MGKRWRKYAVGQYRLGTLRNKKLNRDEAVVCWRDEAGKHRRRLGVFDESAGRSALDAFVGNVEAITARSSQTVGDIFQAYVVDREKDGKLVDTFRHNWKALAPRFATLRIEDVNADICRDYANSRMAQKRSVGTIWTELTRLRSAINWAFKRRVITVCPYVWVPTKPASKQRPLTQEEFMRLLDACVRTPHLRLFAIMAITTGARSEAITGLRWDQVDFAGGTIDLREKTVNNPLTKKVRKGRSIVPMTAEARAALQDARQGALTDHVIEWDGAPIRKIRKAFQAAVVRAGLDGVTPHTLRHTVASWLDEDGIPMERISKMLGHRDVDVTRTIYAKPSVETLRPAGEVIDLRIRRQG